METLASSTISPVEVNRSWIVCGPVSSSSHRLKGFLPAIYLSALSSVLATVDLSIHHFSPGFYFVSRTCSRGHHKQNIWDQQKPAGVPHLPRAESGSVQNWQTDLWSGNLQAPNRWSSMESRVLSSPERETVYDGSFISVLSVLEINTRNLQRVANTGLSCYQTAF